MKTTRVLLLGFGCLLGFAFGQQQQQQQTTRRLYTTKYDNVDIESVVKNERLLKNYVGCLLERNPCTADASELKRNLPDALATNCGSCSEAQKRISDRLSHHLIDHKPEDWAQLEAKYDPTGDYRRRYLHEREMQDRSDNETTTAAATTTIENNIGNQGNDEVVTSLAKDE